MKLSAPGSRFAKKEAKLATGVGLEFARRLGCGFGLPQIVHELLQACLELVGRIGPRQRPIGPH
jgi:hypothetical protein